MAKKSLKEMMMNNRAPFHINPAHKGWCTPMSKSTCTGRRRAFAETAKRTHGFRTEGK